MADRRKKHRTRWAGRERREWLRLGLEMTLLAWRTAITVWNAVH
ncbi:hypothetical protein ABZU32_33705 [Sphaerisporangium sp. NPDC005288]|uniref:IS5/IS1182 family transposase n=1 Tax=Sphaerisporangium rhizosphaerae TaxID=2269375 RepID=A0ABW2P6S7_9ACTN